MGWGTKQGFPTTLVFVNAPTFTLAGGGGQVDKSPALNTPTYTLTVS